jgi:hypothetical protein
MFVKVPIDFYNWYNHVIYGKRLGKTIDQIKLEKNLLLKYNCISISAAIGMLKAMDAINNDDFRYVIDVMIIDKNFYFALE